MDFGLLVCYINNFQCRINDVHAYYAVKSVVELVRYSLTSIPGVRYVLTEHLCQDPLEAFFGRQRMSCGRNNNPNVKTFLQNTVSLRVQGSAAMQPYRANCRRGKRKLRSIPYDNTPLPKRRCPFRGSKQNQRK